MSYILLSKIKRVVYLVIRAAFSGWSCFLIVQCITLSCSLPYCSSSSRFQKYVTQCSPSLKENHIDKNLVNTLQLSKDQNLYKTPPAVESNFWLRHWGSRVLCQGSRVFRWGLIIYFIGKTIWEKYTKNKKTALQKRDLYLENLQPWLACHTMHVVRVLLRPLYQPYGLRTSGWSLPIKKMFSTPGL